MTFHEHILWIITSTPAELMSHIGQRVLMQQSKSTWHSYGKILSATLVLYCFPDISSKLWKSHMLKAQRQYIGAMRNITCICVHTWQWQRGSQWYEWNFLSTHCRFIEEWQFVTHFCDASGKNTPLSHKGGDWTLHPHKTHNGKATKMSFYKHLIWWNTVKVICWRVIHSHLVHIKSHKGSSSPY